MKEARKEITYILDYREKGDKKTTSFKIDFVSIDIIDAVEYVLTISQKAQKMSDDMGKKFFQMEKLKEEKPVGYELQTNQLREEIKEIGAEVMKLDQSDIIDRQLKAVIQLLEDNGIKEEKLLTESFWKKHVDITEIMKFLAFVIYKDVDKKKIIPIL